MKPVTKKMLDRDFLADGTLPLPAHNGAPDLTSHNSAPVLPAVRRKAERIVSLLCRTTGRDVADENNLSLAEELAQDIAELCPEPACPPGCIH